MQLLRQGADSGLQLLVGAPRVSGLLEQARGSSGGVLQRPLCHLHLRRAVSAAESQLSGSLRATALQGLVVAHSQCGLWQRQLRGS